MGEQTRLFWKKWRTRFRWCRITVYLFVLALIGVVLYLNQIGLPDFAKQPLIAALRQHGIQLQFVRLRLNFVHGLVADNVHIGGETPDTPSLSAQELHLQVSYRALLQRKLQLNGVVLLQGQFKLPVSSSNEPPCTLTLDRIQTDLRFETNDVWSLDNFQASFAGATFILSGELQHASAATNWQVFHQKVPQGALRYQWKKIASDLNEIHFDKSTLMNLYVIGDARDFRSFMMRLTVNAPSAETPWASARNVEIVAHSIVPLPYSDAVSTPTREITWKSQLAGLHSEKLDADFIFFSGFWRSPDLQVTNLYARLGGGSLHSAVRLNITTRKFSFTNSSCFDINAITSLLTDKTRARLSQYSFGQPPELQGSGSLILPDWTNRSPDAWRSDVQPTIRLDGRLALTNVLFNGLSFDTAHAHFHYSNEIWTLPHVALTRPEGPMAISGTENDATREYQWHLQGALSPTVIQPFLTSDKAIRGFTNFVFAQPVYLDAQIRGTLYDYDSIIASGHAALTNFSIRGVSVDSAETDFRYAHLVGEFLNPHLQAGEQNMHADGVRLDWPADRLYFTNGLGTADPQQVAKAIGPIPAQVMKPYHFLALPTASVNGYAPLRDPTNADLDFLIIGTASLECLRVKTPDLTGEIHWTGQSLTLTNLSGSFYGGIGDGHAAFDFRPEHSANFSFIADFQKVNLHWLATDLDSPTNHLEGLVGGHFVVTSGNSADWHTCNGYGEANLRDGLLWDVSVFGVLSPVLNAVTPGLGNSRATDAAADFVMTNGVVSTDNLEIHTAMMRLRYDGTVDLKGRLNAHVTGELFRDVPGIGPVVNFLTSPVTKILEYKVSGTLQHPAYKPVYIPKFLLYMVHPIHSLEGLHPNENESEPTKQPSDTTQP